MCLATPVKLKKISGDWGLVETDEGVEKKVNLTLLKTPKVGDWLIAHADMAINTLPEKDAQEINDLIKQSGCHCEI